MANDTDLFSKACGTLVALGILLVASIAAVGPGPVADFLKGPAAGWVQAFGSIAAIYAAYSLGQDSFKKHARLKADEEREKTKAKIQAVKSIMECCYMLDTHLSGEKMLPGSSIDHRRLAREVSEMLRAVPIFELPDMRLVTGVVLARQASLKYCDLFDETLRHAEIVMERKRANYTSVGRVGAEQRRETISACTELLSEKSALD